MLDYLNKIAESFEYGKADPALMNELERKVGNKVTKEFKIFFLTGAGIK